MAGGTPGHPGLPSRGWMHSFPSMPVCKGHGDPRPRSALLRGSHFPPPGKRLATELCWQAVFRGRTADGGLCVLGSVKPEEKPPALVGLERQAGQMLAADAPAPRGLGLGGVRSS